MRNWKLAAIVALFALASAGCADGFNLTGERIIDEGAPAPQQVEPAGAGQDAAGSGGDGSSGAIPDPALGAPSITDPPATDPPATDPPATDPPATDPPATDPPATDPPTTTVPPVREATIKVTLIRFQAIKDCDGIEGFGDFTFNAYVATSDGTVQGSTGGDHQLTDLDYKNYLTEVTFQLPEQSGSAFGVVFISSEVDQDILGWVYNDDRMDEAMNTGNHAFSNGVWTSPPVVSTDLGGTYPTAVQLRNGSGDCVAELHYVVDIT